MSKLKAPCLSLGARGSVSEAITFTKRRGQDIVEKKPELPYFLTLPVQYQRWLYQDYAYLWTQQSLAIKRTYSAEGVRHHLTGFQYWMKYQLTNLPDIAGWWKLDAGSVAVAYDASRHANHGAIFGASPTAGTINGALSFDGVNDYVSIPASASLSNFTTVTIVLYTNPLTFSGAADYLYYHGYLAAPWGTQLWRDPAINRLRWFFRNSLGIAVSRFIPFTPNAPCCLAASWDGTDVSFYYNGVLVPVLLPFAGLLDCSGSPLQLGKPLIARWWDSWIDNFIIYNRALDQTEITRWCERRWP